MCLGQFFYLESQFLHFIRFKHVFYDFFVKVVNTSRNNRASNKSQFNYNFFKRLLIWVTLVWNGVIWLAAMLVSPNACSLPILNVISHVMRFDVLPTVDLQFSECWCYEVWADTPDWAWQQCLWWSSYWIVLHTSCRSCLHVVMTGVLGWFLFKK